VTRPAAVLKGKNNMRLTEDDEDWDDDETMHVTS